MASPIACSRTLGRGREKGAEWSGQSRGKWEGLGTTVLFQLKGSRMSTWQLTDRRVASPYLLRSTQSMTLRTGDAHLQDPLLFLGDNHQ